MPCFNHHSLNIYADNIDSLLINIGTIRMTRKLLTTAIIALSLTACFDDPATKRGKEDFGKLLAEDYQGYELGKFKIEQEEEKARQGMTATLFKMSGVAKVRSDAVLQKVHYEKLVLVERSGSLNDVPFDGKYIYATDGKEIKTDIDLSGRPFNSMLKSSSKYKDDGYEVIEIGSAREKEITLKLSAIKADFEARTKSTENEIESKRATLRDFTYSWKNKPEYQELRKAFQIASHEAIFAKSRLFDEARGMIKKEFEPIQSKKMSEIQEARNQNGIDWRQKDKLVREINAKYQPQFDEIQNKYDDQFHEQAKVTPEQIASDNADKALMKYASDKDEAMTAMQKEIDELQDALFKDQQKLFDAEAWLNTVST